MLPTTSRPSARSSSIRKSHRAVPSTNAMPHHTTQRPGASWLAGGLPAFGVIFGALWLLHLPLLRLPYFWDEAGYFIPAARDLLLTGDLIPHTTLSNAHPPLVMLWLALVWKLTGYSALATRTAMLLVAAAGLA